MKVIIMIQGVTRWDRKRNEDLDTNILISDHCSSDQQEETSMVWQCHEERRKFNDEGCNEVKDEGKETKRKTMTKVVRQHR